MSRMITVFTERRAKLEAMQRPLCMLVEQETYRVLYVGWGKPPEGMVSGQYVSLGGEVAEALYTALAGHRYEQEARDSDRQQALAARRWVYRQPPSLAAKVAARVLIDWGRRICPGLFQWQLRAGRPVRTPKRSYELDAVSR